jgi:hypothetical protein
MDYERCPHTQSFAYQQGKEKVIHETAQRGIDMHAKCADYILHGGEIPAPGFPWNSLANAKPEKKLGFDKDWNLTDYKTAWLKVIPDAYIDTEQKVITIIDFKTGKRQYKEIKHSQQMQLYSAALVNLFPLVDTVVSELWYLNTPGHIHQVIYPAQRLQGIRGRIHLRADAMLSDSELNPKPNKSNCKFCNHNPTQGGNCEFAYEE